MSQTTAIKFTFKSRTLKDDNGQELGKTKKQAPITANLITPTREEIAQVMASEDPAYTKLQSCILDAIVQLQKDQARAQLDEIIEGFGVDETKVVTPEMLDHDKLTLTYIANLEPAARGARALSDEDKEAFYTDYLAVMVQATGKEEKRIKAHIDLFQKPIKAKQNKDSIAIMTTLVDQINVYLTASQQVEDTGEAALRIQGRFSKWLKEDDAFDASAL